MSMMNDADRTSSSRRSSENQGAPARPVGELVSPGVVKLPPWLSVEQARRVAELKGSPYVLVEERRALVGLASLEVLCSAPPHDLLGRWARRSIPVVQADSDVDTALALMTAERLDRLPVLRGAVLLGTVRRDDLQRLATPRELGQAA